MNYFEAHRNKKPKRIGRRAGVYSLAFTMMRVATSTIVAASHINAIASQPIFKGDMTREQKQASAAKIVIEHALECVKILKEEKVRKFKLTGRYT